MGDLSYKKGKGSLESQYDPSVIWPNVLEKLCVGGRVCLVLSLIG